MNTIFNKPINEIITSRHSVRNYENEPLSEDLIKNINDFIETIDNPFNKKVNIKLVTKNTENKDLKLGTYGVIKGANNFFVTSCEDDDISLLALGYSLEKLVLYCTSLGLGTVWLGGTFSKSNFAKTLELKENEILPIVAPVGIESDKKSLLGAIFGKNTNKRKDYSELFFNNNFDTPLTPEESKDFYEPLEMVRLAPSAVNKQPWRVLKKNDDLHFYLANSMKLNKIDMGIALCHFHLTAIEKNISGEFKIVEKPVDSKFTYVISWISK